MTKASFNQKFVQIITSDILACRARKLSFKDLEKRIEAHLSEVDSGFPSHVRSKLEDFVHSLVQRQTDNGARAQNTETQFTYNEDDGIPELFDDILALLNTM